MPSRPSSVGGCIPTPSSNFPPLVWPPMASRRLFCVRAQQGRGEAKTQNCRKGHLQARHSVLYPHGYPYIPAPQNGPQRPPEARAGHKTTPARSTRSKPGYYYLLRAIDNTAQRSLSASHHAQRGPSHCPPMYSTRGGSPSARNLITPVFSVAARSGAGSRFQKPSTGGLVAFSGHSFPRARLS